MCLQKRFKLKVVGELNGYRDVEILVDVFPEYAEYYLSFKVERKRLKILIFKGSSFVYDVLLTLSYAEFEYPSFMLYCFDPQFVFNVNAESQTVKIEDQSNSDSSETFETAIQRLLRVSSNLY